MVINLSYLPHVFAMLLTVGLDAGCKRNAQQTREESRMTSMNPSTSASRVQMVEGPRLETAEDLRRWLDENSNKPDGHRRRFRLPVTLRFADEYRLALGAGSIGSIEVRLDDTAMQTPLLEAVKRQCPQGQTTCTLWLEGYWGPLINVPNMPSFDPPGTKHFAVLRVDQAVASNDSDIRAQMEAP